MASRIRPIPILLVANLALFAFAVSYVDQTAAAAQEVESFCPEDAAACKCADLDPWGPCGCMENTVNSSSDCLMNEECGHVCGV